MKAVNLIPAEQRAGGGSVTGDSDGGAFLVIGLLAGLAVLALMYGIASHQISSRKGEVASVTAQAQATQARASELTPYVSFESLYQSRLQAVSQLAGTRFDWAHAFHEIGRVLPKDASLSAVRGVVGSANGSSSSSSASASKSSASVTSATPPGAVPVFTLTGCATSQSEVAETLQRLRLIDGVSSVTLQSSTKSSSAGGGGAGNCPEGDPAFALQVTFTGLPTPAAAPGAATTSTAAATGSPAASTPAPAASSSSSSGGAQ